ncbi:MAG: sigma-70 family RNA polymerase sigma factor [Pyrinomonadaceae bacterium]
MPFGQRIAPEDFEAAALPYVNDLLRVAVRLTGSRAEAEDLVQEVYLQAWKSFHRFELGTNCRAWLFKILLNKANRQRRKWFQFRAISESEKVIEELIYAPPIGESLDDEEVLSALQKIPQQYREAVLLADVEEFSYKEICFILKIPIGTVMSRLSRGRKLLRAELATVAETYGIKNNRKKTQRGEI